MYKAKILSINTDKTFNISIPSMKLENVKAYAITQEKGRSGCLPGDLVIVSQTNDHSWVILGLVYGAK